jgi:hypothetical protein
MKHISFFINQKKKLQEAQDPVLEDVLTEAGAKLMALGSPLPRIRVQHYLLPTFLRHNAREFIPLRTAR